MLNLKNTSSLQRPSSAVAMASIFSLLMVQTASAQGAPHAVRFLEETTRQQRSDSNAGRIIVAVVVGILLLIALGTAIASIICRRCQGVASRTDEEVERNAKIEADNSGTDDSQDDSQDEEEEIEGDIFVSVPV